MSDIDAMNVGPRWYVAHTYSGYESKVKANLEKIVENRGLGDLIFDVRIPVETVVVKENGEEKTVESKIFPSYVFVKMVMTTRVGTPCAISPALPDSWAPAPAPRPSPRRRSSG